MPLQRFTLIVKKNSISINKLNITHKHTLVTRIIFNVLLEQYMKDLDNNKKYTQYNFLSTYEIAEEIKKYGLLIQNKKVQITKPLEKIKTNINIALQRKCPKFSHNNIVIQTKENCDNQGNIKYNSYRLNPSLKLVM